MTSEKLGKKKKNSNFGFCGKSWKNFYTRSERTRGKKSHQQLSLMQMLTSNRACYVDVITYVRRKNETFLIFTIYRSNESEISRQRPTYISLLAPFFFNFKESEKLFPPSKDSSFLWRCEMMKKVNVFLWLKNVYAQKINK